MSSGQVRSATLQRFDEGVLLIHYSGHGAITQWANERLLHESDWVSLRNTGRYPFVFVTNCLSGNFASPFYRSIAETFTHSGPRGAIGFFASTGVNTPFGQHQMAQEAYKLLWAGQTQIGPLVTMAKNRIGADGSHLDIIRSWVLIGDPALRLAYPR
jgi:hypothetical protein